MPFLVDQQLGSVSGIINSEPKFAELETGTLRVYLDGPLTDEEIKAVEDSIKSKGAVLTAPIVYENRVLIIKFQKAIGPLEIIALSLSTLSVGISGWQLFKDQEGGFLAAPFGVPLWFWGAVGGTIFVLYLVMKEKEYGKKKAKSHY